MISLSPIKAVEERVRATPGVLSLAQGIPHFPIPEAVWDLLERCIRDGRCNAYLPPWGLQTLRERVQQNYGSSSEEVCIVNGAIEGLVSTLLSLCRHGDEVILPVPTYASFERAILLAGAVPVFFSLPEHSDGEWDEDSFLRLITARTKAILFAHPNNPTGNILPPERLSWLISCAHRYGLTILSDETYREFVWNDETYVSPCHLPGGAEVCVRILSFSKTFGITGWRAGAILSSPERMQTILPCHDTCVTCAPAVSQFLVQFLEDDRERIIETNRRILIEKLESAFQRLQHCRLVSSVERPESGYYFFPTVSEHHSDIEAYERAFSQASVAIVPGNAFREFARHRIRISVAAEAKIVENALHRLSGISWGEA